LLALRVADHVEPVRALAWDALAGRCRAEQAGDVAPVLIALGARRRASDAMERYAALYRGATGEAVYGKLVSMPSEY